MLRNTQRNKELAGQCCIPGLVVYRSFHFRLAAPSSFAKVHTLVP